jgi:hypothetical protein
MCDHFVVKSLAEQRQGLCFGFFYARLAPNATQQRLRHLFKARAERSG